MSGPAVARCEACASPLEPDDHFCEECGTRVGDEPLELPHVPDGRVELDLTVAAAVTDQGRVHRRNEDAFHLERIGDVVVAIVCDGISTAASGDLASASAAAAAGVVLADAVRSGAANLRQATVEAATAAHSAVAGLPFTVRSDVPVPSCTLVSAVCTGDEIVIGWLGDSRAYVIADGDSRQLTVDDSWASEQVAAGLLSAEEAARDRRAHAITRWVGSDAPPGPPQVVVEPVHGVGGLVLCSDGVWNYASSPEALAALVERLPAESSPAAVARTLADVALERGGHDNITAVVVELDPSQEASR